jgi:hypothetical protein
MTATPNSETKPTAADTLKGMPRRYSTTTPPPMENGTVARASAASRTDPKVQYSRAKIIDTVTGRIH